jgi:hypothetical protein
MHPSLLAYREGLSPSVEDASMALLLAITILTLVAYNNLNDPILQACVISLVFITLIFIGHIIALIARDYLNHFVYILTINSKF